VIFNSEFPLRTTRDLGKATIFILLVFLSFVFHCAKEGMPPGGPEDTVPPEVVSVSPQPGSTHVDLGSRIEITFSERMLAEITEESIFISPLPRKPSDFGWRGKRLIITPGEALLPDRTYVISVGTDAQDLRRNRLSQSYTCAFSTGKELDYGNISGQVWAEQAVGLSRELGASVWAYVLGGDRTEVDPEKEKPDYVTQTGDQGNYMLKNLSLGTYRLFAVQDLNRDLLWDWEKEAIGVTTGDAVLSEWEISKTDVDFVLDRKDKSPPSLLGCHSLTNSLLRLEFDQELQERTVLDSINYQIISVSTQKPVTILSVFFQEAKTRRVFLLTDGISPQQEYELKVVGVTDIAGNPLDTASNSCLFEASEIADTAGPTLLAVSPEDQETGVSLDAKIKLCFDEPPQRQPVPVAFSLVDSNQVSIDGKGDWLNPTTYLFSPVSPLAGETKYLARLQGGKIRDLLGNSSAADSAFTSSFVTLDPEILGSVSGEVAVSPKQQPTTVVLILWHTEEGEPWYEKVLPQPGPFALEDVLPGKYFLAGYADLDGNKDLSLGEPRPFFPMEPFVVHQDTIVVRSRWETEAIKLTFH
jgi:uncharacterized protein (DUF2141 family)